MELKKGSAFILCWICFILSLKHWIKLEKDVVVDVLDQVVSQVNNPKLSND